MPHALQETHRTKCHREPRQGGNGELFRKKINIWSSCCLKQRRLLIEISAFTLKALSKKLFISRVVPRFV